VESGSPEHALASNMAAASRIAMAIDLVARIEMASFEKGLAKSAYRRLAGSRPGKIVENWRG
jgi:hypothetical protein